MLKKFRYRNYCVSSLLSRDAFPKKRVADVDLQVSFCGDLFELESVLASRTIKPAVKQ